MATPAAIMVSSRPRRRFVTSGGAFAVFVIALLWFGTHFPIARYISPQRGVGYALGIIGGSMMLLLLLYPLRKRVRWLRFMGRMSLWFRVHMVLGVMGPVLILFHANFSTGATNSNVALACMLIVSGSGLFGRYFYAQIHHGLYGQRATLNELRSADDNLRGQVSSIHFLPELVGHLERAEVRLAAVGNWPGLKLLSPVFLTANAAYLKWRLHRYVRESLAQLAFRSTTLTAERPRLSRTVCAYVDRRINSAKRVAAFQAYERLFALWHVLHLPLFFMLIIAGIVHVVAVHVY